jgi:hypothetical protein
LYAVAPYVGSINGLNRWYRGGGKNFGWKVELMLCQGPVFAFPGLDSDTRLVSVVVPFVGQVALAFQSEEVKRDEKQAIPRVLRNNNY